MFFLFLVYGVVIISRVFTMPHAHTVTLMKSVVVTTFKEDGRDCSPFKTMFLLIYS